MSSYDDRDVAVSREAVTTPQQRTAPGPQAYGYSGRTLRARGAVETKPFFLTSEFLMTVLGIIAVAITAAVATDIDSRLATELVAGLIAAYTISRGIAKAGTSSRAMDPREDLTLGRGHDRSTTGAANR
jgi:hypothetical protein